MLRNCLWPLRQSREIDVFEFHPCVIFFVVLHGGMTFSCGVLRMSLENTTGAAKSRHTCSMNDYIFKSHFDEESEYTCNTGIRVYVLITSFPATLWPRVFYRCRAHFHYCCHYHFHWHMLDEYRSVGIFHCQ